MFMISSADESEDPYFNLALDSSVTQIAATFGYTANVLKNDNSEKISKWKLFVWNVDTTLLKIKNRILNRYIRPTLFKLRK